MSYQLDSFGLFCETFTVASGQSITIMPVPGQLELQALKYISGGSLSVATAFPLVAATATIGTSLTQGSTWAISTLYTLGTSEILDLKKHRGPLNIVTTGATVTFALLRTMGQGVVNL